MKNLLAALILCASASLTAAPAALAQGPPAGSNWDRLQGLPAGTSLYITSLAGARKSTQRCTLKAVAADAITCTGGRAVRDSTYPRSDIQAVKLSRRRASTLTGAAIGLGAGAAIGAGVDASFSNSNLLGRHKANAALIGAGLGLLFLTPIAYATDFLRGPTVYRTP